MFRYFFAVLFVTTYDRQFPVVDALDLKIREDSKLFIRANIKVNTFEFTRIFAYGLGYRFNFGFRPQKKSKSLFYDDRQFAAACSNNNNFNTFNDNFTRPTEHHVRYFEQYALGRHRYYAHLIIWLALFCYEYVELNVNSGVYGQKISKFLENEFFDRNLTAKSRLFRKKRFAVFPEGSSFTVAMCVTLKLMTPDYDIFTEAVNWALTYDLPASPQDYERPKPLPINVTKRSAIAAYRILEMLFKEYNLDGKACVLRMLCESRQLLLSSEATGFVQLLLKIILRYKAVFENVMDIDLTDYDELYKANCDHRKSDRNNCKRQFSRCPISFLHLILSV